MTYNVYRDPQGMDRPWELDMIPLLIPPAEWAQIETALAQRARLLNLVLADVYGPQRLVREGLLPCRCCSPIRVFYGPATAFRFPVEFICTCTGWTWPGRPAANGGRWRIARSRPRARATRWRIGIVLRRSLPEAFRDCQVHRLASFFRLERETLTALAPARSHHPQVVLLTPGPYNETYFEHAYLARYLGFPLVEGGDLTVRDRRVFIKTLEGLQPVDVILRRLDDSFCDPLELRPIPSWAWRAWSRRRAPATSPLPTRWARASSKRRPFSRFCQSCAGTCSARNCGCRRWRPGGAVSRRNCSTCSIIWVNSS